MNRASITIRARADLDNIWLFIARDRPSAADQLLDKFGRVFEDLARHPQMGESRPELGRRIRAFSVGSYVIYFQTVDAGVEIVRIIHGARNVTDLRQMD